MIFMLDATDLNYLLRFRLIEGHFGEMNNARCRRIFERPSTQFIEMLCSPGCLKLLDTVRARRRGIGLALGAGGSFVLRSPGR